MSSAHWLLKGSHLNFHGGPMVKTPTSNVGDVQGTKMLHATQQKNKLKKKKKKDFTWKLCTTILFTFS